MGLLRKPVRQGRPCPRTPGAGVAIYSLHHSTIGRSTHAAGTAGAHIGYITRAGSLAEVMAERMPTTRPGRGGGEARAWLDEQEAGDRKNGRVIDKVMVAVPRELSAAQQLDLVRGFAEEVTQGRAPWLAAVHRDHPDNPHAHIVIRDKDPETGKRVAGLSEKGSTDRLRETWERHANRALEQAGQEERIDRRTLAAQGVEREAQVHVGPKAHVMERQRVEGRERGRGASVVSRERVTKRGREVRWPQIDGGRTRAEHNAAIRARNAERAQEAVRAAQKGSVAAPGPSLGVQPSEAVLRPHSASVRALVGVQPIEVVPGTTFAALDAIWTRHVGNLFDQIRDRTLKLIAMAEDQRRRLFRRHRAAEPQQPALKLLAGRKHQQERAVWEREGEALRERALRIGRRIKRLEEFTREGAKSPGYQLAAAKFAAQQPEFMKAITAAHQKDQAAQREQETAAAIQKAREERKALAEKIRRERVAAIHRAQGWDRGGGGRER